MTWFRKDSATRARVECIEVVQAYGAVLEDEPYGAGGTISETKLPYAKALIKAALVDVATTPGVPASQLTMLHQGFLQLAAFRVDGGGKSPIWNSTKAAPTSRERLAEFFVAYGDSKEIELAALVAEETKVLEQEWDLRVKIAEAVRHA